MSPSLHTVNDSAISAVGEEPPSVLRRLRSTISTASMTTQPRQRSNVHPSDFRKRPEIPEKRFIDSLGVVIPGVCDRVQCGNERVHFVLAFQLSDAIEYTTALADHGLTYSDYVRLVDAVRSLMADLLVDSRRSPRDVAATLSTESQRAMKHPNRGWLRGLPKMFAARSQRPFQQAQRHAAILNRLLEEISQNLQARGVAVVVSVSSFSIFAPEQISEAHIQILHAPLTRPRKSTKDYARAAERLSFIDPGTFAEPSEQDFPAPQSDFNDGVEPFSVTEQGSSRLCYHGYSFHSQVQVGPWSLWPNAIPSSKRRTIAENAERYGIDPYFRSWMRANLGSRTTCSTYTKYIAEQEDSFFVDGRLGYDDNPSSSALAWITSRAVNQSRYRHNRRLELRKSVERGSRLRLLRFSGCTPLHPPHNPEMDELGLSKDVYEALVARIDQIFLGCETFIRSPYTRLSSVLNKFRNRKSDGVLSRLCDYIRELNAAQRRIIWTLETIPGIYDKQPDWEVSAWNGEDPLELLVELERWGLVKKWLNVDEEN